MMLNYRWIRIALVAFAFGCVHMSHAQQSAVVLATGPGGDKVFLRIDAALLRGDLDTLYTTTAGLQDQIDTLSWEDVLVNGTTPGVDVDFFGYSALGLGSVTTSGMFTGDSLFLNKDAVISGRLNVNDVVSLTDSLLVSGTVVLGDSIRVVGAASFGSRLHVTGVTAFGDSIHVVGNVDLDALFHVDGAATFGSTITVSGETTLNDTLRVQSAALVRDSLDVQGQAFFNDEVHLNDSLVVLGSGSIAGSLDVLGESNFTGDAYFGDSLAVVGIASFASEVSFTDSLHGTAADFSGVLTADSLVATKVINGQIRDLANHNTDDLVETSTNRYYTPARELALQAQIDSLESQMSELLDLLFNPPTVTTTAASSVLVTTASLNATYVDGGASPSDAGFIISTSSIFADSTIHVVSASGGALLEALTGLTKGTTYYYKAYIETIMGSATGSVQQFTTIGDVVLAATPPASVTGQTTTGLSSSITSAGGGTVTATGFKYSTNANLSGASTIAGSATSGTFTANLSGLTRETLYYFTPFATNEAGTVYGDTLSFTTFDMCNDQTTLAYNGYTYDIVAIGGQCWFAENLQTTLQNDGNAVPNMFNDGYYPPNGDGSKVATHGYLYGYYSHYNLCPVGWAIPSSADFTTLTTTAPNLGDLKAGATVPGWDGSNASGFNALPAGKAMHPGMSGGNIPVSSGFGAEAHFWTTTNEALFRINSSGSGIDNYGSNPMPFNMASVRCIKQ